MIDVNLSSITRSIAGLAASRPTLAAWHSTCMSLAASFPASSIPFFASFSASSAMWSISPRRRWHCKDKSKPMSGIPLFALSIVMCFMLSSMFDAFRDVPLIIVTTPMIGILTCNLLILTVPSNLTSDDCDELSNRLKWSDVSSDLSPCSNTAWAVIVTGISASICICAVAVVLNPDDSATLLFSITLVVVRLVIVKLTRPVKSVICIDLVLTTCCIGL
mmetsp:Transcript_18381/g.48514  ORF Transcript_18381/g.48514 Transcript_18381/m.48514 type:complete len:219 (-) Transcript_18381:453-1109(-)